MLADPPTAHIAETCSFPRGRATKILVLVSFVGIFGGVVSYRGARRGRRLQPHRSVLAGLVAGSTIGALTATSFAVVGNVWLDIPPGCCAC